MAYVSNRLVHWAGSGKTPEEQYALLTRHILKPKLLRYSSSFWHFSSQYGGVTQNTFPIVMICFTDIPFSETDTHCKRYSQFGISFEKSYLVNCLACPVGYVQHPFLHQNFSYIFHALTALKDKLPPVTLDKGADAGKAITVQGILSRFMYIMVFMEDYSRQEYTYNAAKDEPLPGQQAFFEDPGCQYFEREWRMVLSPTALNLPWHLVKDGSTYFKLNEKYMGPIVMPRDYIARFNIDRDEVFAEYDRHFVPPVIAYEDLRFM